MRSPHSGTGRGALWLVVAIAAWTGFALSTRSIGHSQLSAVDVQAIRYITPALLLAPWWPRVWREVRSADPLACALIALGGGVPFFWLTSAGARLSSAAHISVINLGAVPVMLAVLAFVIRRRLPVGKALAGLVAITAGVVLMSLSTPGAGVGVVLLLGSAALWTVLTLAQERAQLSALAVMLVIAAPSAVLSAALAAPGAAEVVHAPVEQVLSYVLVQGLGSGVVSTVAYARAIRFLGADRCARFAALTPMPVLLLSSVLLADPLTVVVVAGLALVALGVLVQPRPAVRAD